MKGLENNGTLSVKSSGITLFSDVWNEQIAEDLGLTNIRPHYDRKSGLFYVFQPKEYSIENGGASRSFKFHIRNHYRLLTSTKEVHVSKANKNLIIDENLNYVKRMMDIYNY